MKTIGMWFLQTVFLVIVACSTAQAQEPGGLEITKVSGTLQATVGYQIRLKADDDQDYMAVVNPQQSTFSYTGTADIKFLVPGLLVRFTAAFDQAGKSHAPLKEIEIFNQVRKRRMRPQEIQDQTPGIYPVAKPDKDQPPAPAGFENYRIVGKLVGVQGDKIQVAAGLRPIMVQIDPEIAIKVSSGDTSFCMEGDAIEVTGLRNPNQQNWIQAETVLVTGAKPLVPPEKKLRGSRTDRTRRAKTEEPADGDKPR